MLEHERGRAGNSAELLLGNGFHVSGYSSVKPCSAASHRAAATIVVDDRAGAEEGDQPIASVPNARTKTRLRLIMAARYSRSGTESCMSGPFNERMTRKLWRARRAVDG